MTAGGFVLLARQLLGSDIWDKPPLWTKLFNWFLLRAEWREGQRLARGTLETSIAEMQQAMSWHVGFCKHTPTRDEIRKSYEGLAKAATITTTKTTRGLLVTIVNYCKYQDISAYEAHDEAHNESLMKASRSPHEGSPLASPLKIKQEKVRKNSPPTPPSGGCVAPLLAPEPAAPAPKPRRPRVYPQAFEEIWAAVHPLMRRCGKKIAAASWDKARRSGELPPQKQVLDALAAYRATKEAEPDPKICHLSVWFNQGRWDIGQDVEDRRLVRDREVRSASAARASADQDRKARMDAAWAAAWDKLSESIKAQWRARVEARSPIFEAARARGKPMAELVELTARSAWRRQREQRQQQRKQIQETGICPKITAPTASSAAPPSRT